MKNMVIFPYNLDFEFVLKYSHMLNPEYAIKYLVSPHGWKLCGNRVAYRKDGEAIQYLQVQSNFNEMPQDVDTLLIPSFKSNSQYEKIVLEKTVSILSQLQTVICCNQFNKEFLGFLQNKCQQAECNFINWITPQSPTEFSFYNEKKYDNDFDFLSYDESKSSLLPINTPIIAIAGMGENTDKFEVSLSLRKQLSETGYQVSQIGSRNYCELLGFHSFPSFMLNEKIDERLKIVLFNRYMKQIEEIERPDLLIITIPGAIQNFSQDITQGFGLLPYMVCQAVLVDYFILCSYFVEKNSDRFFNTLQEMCKYKFNCGVDCFHMSKNQIDAFSTFEFMQLITKSVENERVKESVQSQRMPPEAILIDIHEEQGRQELYQDIMDKLGADCVAI